jgi:hypothetical protein
VVTRLGELGRGRHRGRPGSAHDSASALAKGGPVRLSTGRVTPWKALRPDDLTGVAFIWHVAITPDGESYADQYSRLLKDLYLIEDLRQD